MHSFFFGTSDARLFGVYHSPGTNPRNLGAVICPALHEECNFSHRSVRVLANTLAKAGIPTLRFDYHGTGDSVGEGEDVSLDQCRLDIASAATELRDMCGVSRIVLVGLRLGAALAATVPVELPGVQGVMLWDPVVRGRQYLNDLAARHLAIRTNRRSWKVDENYTDGLCGYPLPPGLQSALKALDLTALKKFPGNKVYFSHCEDSPDYTSLSRHLRALDVEVSSRLVAGQRIWEENSLKSNELIPAQMLSCLADWLVEK